MTLAQLLKEKDNLRKFENLRKFYGFGSRKHLAKAFDMPSKKCTEVREWISQEFTTTDDASLVAQIIAQRLNTPEELLFLMFSIGQYTALRDMLMRNQYK